MFRRVGISLSLSLSRFSSFQSGPHDFRIVRGDRETGNEAAVPLGVGLWFPSLISWPYLSLSLSSPFMYLSISSFVLSPTFSTFDRVIQGWGPSSEDKHL